MRRVNEGGSEREAGQPQRGRLTIVIAATLLLAGVVLVAALGSSSGAPEEETPEDCLAAWNGDRVALSDGVHAYDAHDYRAVLVTRVDDAGTILDPGAAEGRCAVVFAAPQVDSEPDFGVRVYTSGDWAGLAITDAVALEDIARSQRDATATANATLLPDGSLTDAS